MKGLGAWPRGGRKMAKRPEAPGAWPGEKKKTADPRGAAAKSSAN